MPYRVTTVCLGNICRSPMAEAVLRAAFDRAGLADLVEVDSAGTGGWHVGADADPRALETLRAADYELTHSARQFDPDWLVAGQSDLILAMDRENLAALTGMAESAQVSPDAVHLLRSFDPTADPLAEVPDPYYGGAEGFAEVLAMIERAAVGVVAAVARDLGLPQGMLPPP